MNRIKEIRKKHRISQVRLSDMLHVHQTAVSQWENGRTSPDIDNLRQMSEIFNVSIDYLLGRDASDPTGSRLSPDTDDLLSGLTPDELQRVRDFVTGLKASRLC